MAEPHAPYFGAGFFIKRHKQTLIEAAGAGNGKIYKARPGFACQQRRGLNTAGNARHGGAAVGALPQLFAGAGVYFPYRYVAAAFLVLGKVETGGDINIKRFRPPPPARGGVGVVHRVAGPDELHGVYIIAHKVAAVIRNVHIVFHITAEDSMPSQ